MSAEITLTFPATLPWDARTQVPRKPLHSGAGHQQGAHPIPTGPLSGEQDNSCQDLKGRSGSPRVCAGAGLLGWLGESVLPAWLLGGTAGGPEGHAEPQPAAFGRAYHISTRGLGSCDSGRVGCLGAGGPMCCLRPRGQLGLAFHARCSRFDCMPGLGTAPMHHFRAPGL